MTVKLLHHTPLWVVNSAIRTCYNSYDKSDGVAVSEDGDVIHHYFPSCLSIVDGKFSHINLGKKDKELIDRVGNKLQHESVKNHINYSFFIEGVTTKTLLALTRHDIGVEFSVQSTRFTTKKMVKNGKITYTKSKNELVNKYLSDLEVMIKDCVSKNIDNDEISLLLPQAWQYNLVVTFSMTALQHFLKLRSKKEAHWDIRQLSKELFFAIPEDHRFLFQPYMNFKDIEE